MGNWSYIYDAQDLIAKEKEFENNADTVGVQERELQSCGTWVQEQKSTTKKPSNIVLGKTTSANFMFLELVKLQKEK